MEKVNKISLPVAILIMSIILSGVYYMVEISKQRSIQEQQEITRQEERRNNFFLNYPGSK